MRFLPLPPAGIGAERDAIAVVYFALTAMTDLWPPLVVLDWSVEHIEGGLLDAWTPAVLQRVAALDRQCEARSGVSGLMIEAEGLGVELWERAYHWGLAVELTADELVKIDLAQRAVSASSYVRGGKVVFSRVAREKTQAFRGVLRNHLVDCATKFNGAEPVQPELLAAFSDGVLAALKNRRVRERRAA